MSYLLYTLAYFSTESIHPRDFITVKNVKTYEEKTKTTVMLGQRGGSFYEISVTAKTACNVSSMHWARLFRRATLFSVNTFKCI